MRAPQGQVPRKQVLLPNRRQNERTISPVRRVLVAYQPITYSQRLVKPLPPSRWFKVPLGVKRHEPRVKMSLPVKSLNKYFHNKSPVLLLSTLKSLSQVPTGSDSSEIPN